MSETEVQKDYFTIEDLKAKGGLEGVLIGTRVDVNTTLKSDNRFGINQRIITAMNNVSALTDLGARVVVLAHNGRKGKPDYVDLSGMLRDVRSETAVRGVISRIDYGFNPFDHERRSLNKTGFDAVRDLEAGRAFLLENIRYMDDETLKRSAEEHAQVPLVRRLIDDLGMEFYVSDAFSVAHRPHMSIVGFSELPMVAGLQMDTELSALGEVKRRLMEDGGEGVYVLGGKKISDYFGLMRRSLEEARVSKILTGGFLANLCLFAQGVDLGEPTKQALKREKDGTGKSMWDYMGELKGLMDQYEYTFVVPEDVAYDVGGRRVDCPVDNIPGDVKSASPCLDIGGETDLKYSDIIRHAQVIYMKGPLGKYEDRPFASGSSRVLSTFAGSRGYSVIGGGDTTSMFDHFSLDHDKIRHISLAGGALVRALAGEELPGVEVLKASYRNAEHRTAMGLK